MGSNINSKILRKVKKEIRDQNIVIDYLENRLTTKEIAKKNKIANAYVYRILYAYDVKVEKNRTTKGRYILISKYYSLGNSAEKAAEQFGVSIYTVYRALKFTNTKTRQKLKEMPQKHKDIVERLLRGESQADIARDYKCSRQYIQQLKIKYLTENN